MTKREFFDALSDRIRSLPKEEVNRTITYYNEILEDYMEDGMTEEEAVAKLEDVDVIAQRILHSNEPEQPPYSAPAPYGEQAVPPREKKHTGLFVALAIVGFPIWFPLVMAFFSVIFSVIVSLFSIIISLIAIPVGLAAGAIGGVGVSPVLFYTGQTAKGFVMLGGGLICAALSIFSIMLMVWLVKWIWRLIRWICRQVRRLFTRRKAVA